MDMMNKQEGKAVKEPQVRKLMEELFTAIAKTEEHAEQLSSSLEFVMQQEPPEVAEKDHERSGSCEMSDQLLRAIRQVEKLGNRLATMRKRLEI